MRGIGGKALRGIILAATMRDSIMVSAVGFDPTYLRSIRSPVASIHRCTQLLYLHGKSERRLTAWTDTHHAGVVQWLEHLSYTQPAVGSTPTASTTHRKMVVPRAYSLWFSLYAHLAEMAQSLAHGICNAVVAG